jgi:hypothetical protein
LNSDLTYSEFAQSFIKTVSPRMQRDLLWLVICYNKEWGRIMRLKSPAMRHKLSRFSKSPKIGSIVKNELSVISTTPY